MDNKSFNEVISFFPADLKIALERVSDKIKHQATEIRLRVNKPLSVTVGDRQVIIAKSGGEAISPKLVLIVEMDDINKAFENACNSSVHCHKKEICNGFITLKGGHRVGICGNAVSTDEGDIANISPISSMNYRIARQIIGSADGLINLTENNSGVLIVGAPACGKTTILRDLCRIIGNTHTVTLIDDRGEIGASFKGIPQNNIGIFTDVFNGYGKGFGIETTIRVMSPQYIICDEIGGEDDCNAILSNVNTGVKIIVTAHGGSIQEVSKRPYIKKLIKSGVFKYIVLLERYNISAVSEIKV